MFTRNTIIQLIAVGVLLVCLSAAGMMSTTLTSQIGRAQLVYTDEAEEGDPPEVAIGIAMGAFRGLFVNYLWIRANRLKEEGKFYEAIELSETITRLQPRFPRVWIFHAWNMAYNISVATNTAEERWEWVQAGINLLRSKAIPRNPNDVLLHKELAWIYVHKIQGFTDDANHYYKKRVAREWTIILGPPPDRPATGEFVDMRDEFAEWLTPILDAPETIEAVIEEEIEAKLEADAENPTSDVQTLVSRIRNDANLGLDENLLRLYELRRAYSEAWYTQDSQIALTETDRNDVLDELIRDERYKDAWNRLLPHVRRRVLIDDYNMEPSRMIAYTKRLGPLDWRHPAVHALYWAVRGVEVAEDRTIRDDFNALNTDRTAMHATQEIWRSGDVEYDLLSDEYFTLPNFEFTDTYGQLIETVRERAGMVDDEDRFFRMYSEGYANFLKDVIRVFYRRGWIELAEKYHEKLRTADWLNLTGPSDNADLALPLEEFVKKEMRLDRINVPHVAVSEIESALYEAFLKGLYQGDMKLFRNNLRYAKKAWDEFAMEQNTRTTAADEQRMLEYVGERFSVMVNRVLVRLLTGGDFAVSGPRSIGGTRAGAIGPTQAGELYRKLPVDVQLSVYDQLLQAAQSKQYMTEQRFNRLFPPPPGLEEFRESVQDAMARSDAAIRRQIQFEKN